MPRPGYKKRVWSSVRRIALEFTLPPHNDGAARRVSVGIESRFQTQRISVTRPAGVSFASPRCVRSSIRSFDGHRGGRDVRHGVGGLADDDSFVGNPDAGLVVIGDFDFLVSPSSNSRIRARCWVGFHRCTLVQFLQGWRFGIDWKHFARGQWALDGIFQIAERPLCARQCIETRSR
jgi:hypothetical protein